MFFDMIPQKGNPRNSEGSFLELSPGGEILFVYSAFLGDLAADHTMADLRLIRSTDRGNTWSEPQTIVSASTYDAMNVMSVSLISLPRGQIGLMYLVRKSWLDMYIAFQVSTDCGKTWDKPVRVNRRTSFFVVNNDRLFRTSSGRLIIPAADHPNRLDEDGHLLFAPARTVFFYSDDDGTTWQETGTCLELPPVISSSGLQEPCVIELSEGVLYGWARCDLGRQMEFFSCDDGLQWTDPRPSPFTSPLSPMSMARLQDGRLIALWNPVPVNNICPQAPITMGRTPLVYALSPDDGATWSEPDILEHDPHHGYCYTAILSLEDAVLLAYCAGGQEDFGLCLNRLRIRRVPLERLEEKPGQIRITLPLP